MIRAAALLATTLLTATSFSAQAESVKVNIKEGGKEIYSFSGEMIDGTLQNSSAPRPRSVSSATEFEEFTVEVFPHNGTMNEEGTSYWDIKATITRVDNFTSYNGNAPTPDTSSMNFGRTLSASKEPVTIEFGFDGLAYSMELHITE